MSTPARLVQRIGLAVVATGLIVAAGVFVTANEDPGTDPLLEQREMREVARLGGTATVQTVKFKLWLASLWHGDRLAGTIALLALGVGGACWRIGGLMDEEVEDVDFRA
jgi:hypothetical protein